MPEHRPHWWPADQPFPPIPHRGRYWRGFLLIPIGLLFLVGFIAGRGFHGLWLLWPLGFLLFLVIAGRSRPRWFPVGRLVEAAGRLADGDYSARVPDVEGGPMREVVRSFNGMARRLEESALLRRRWLADLGHELRTPLTVIQGEIEAMAEGVHPADPGHLELLLEETRLIARLLDDLRTLSLSEAGELRLEKEEVVMADLLEDAAAPIRATAARSGTTIEVRADPGRVDVDPMRIREVVTNLIVNALRHSPEGGLVSLRALRLEAGWQIEVADRGPGIPPDLLPHVFERFVKIADSGGTGLGLSIARDLVRAHGGEMTVANPTGEGTTIVFTLP
ncbi:MAG: sensor histidine kinase [Actinomycetota bacterium]